MRFALPFLLALAACAVEPVESAPAPLMPLEPMVLASAPVADTRAHPLVVVDAELADAVSQALALWTEATGGRYAPRLVIGDDSTAAAVRIRLVGDLDCDGVYAWACWARRSGVLEISRNAAPDMVVSSIAHEIGHTLGLEHGCDGLMSLDRSNAERRAPCVSAGNVAAAGFAGPGACL